MTHAELMELCIWIFWSMLCIIEITSIILFKEKTSEINQMLVP